MSSKLDKPIITHSLFSSSQSTVEDNHAGEELVFKRNDTTTIFCQLFEAEADSPVILFFPSKSLSAEAFAPHAKAFQNLGISIIFVNYDVQGAKSGFQYFSQALDNAEYLVRTVSERLFGEGKKNQFFVMGQSLGTVFAIDSVLKNIDQVKGLILDSSICLTIPFLLNTGVAATEIDLAEEEGFNTLNKISKITLPTIIFHGSRDPLVKAAEAEALQACCGARSKQFFVIPGGTHADLFTAGGDTYFTTLKAYIYSTCGLNTWRQRRRKFRAGQNG